MKNYIVECASSVGPKEKNQDAFAFNQIVKVGGYGSQASVSFSCKIKVPANQLQCAVVADGVSKSALGELASFTVVNAVAKAFEEGKLSTCDINLLKERFDWVMADASMAIRESLDSIGLGKSNSATTVSAVTFKDKKMACYNIGDSPVYSYRRGKLKALHEEHTLGAEKKRYNETRGFIDRLFKREVIIFSHDFHVLTKAIRSAGKPEIESSFSTEDFLDQDVLILSSDGLNCLNESDIIDALNQRFDEENTAQNLIEKAFLNHLSDNITIIIIYMEKEGEEDE